MLSSKVQCTVRPTTSSRKAAVVCKCIKQDTPRSFVRSIASAAAAGVLLLSPGLAFADVASTTAPGTNVGFLSNEEVSTKRNALHFARAYDGKVAIESRQGAWWDVKLDLKSPGTLLLRSPQGAVHYLAYESLQQIDLSDDEIVGAIASSNWESGVQPVEAQEGERIERLELTREGFYELFSVVDP